MPARCARSAAAAAAALALLAGAAAWPARAAEPQRAILLLPIASGTPGQEASARALGWILEEDAAALRGLRIVGGVAREGALRELAARESITPEEFLAICRRAGADLAALGGSTLVEGRLALELRIFDVAAAKEVRSFRGKETTARAFALVAAAVRHLAAATGVELGGEGEARLARVPAASLEAYGAYRAALLEAEPAARIERLRGALALDERYFDAAQRLGVELFRRGEHEEALALLERAVSLGPAAAEARNNLGVVLATLGRAERAQREFEQAVDLLPTYAEARLNLARVLEDRGSLTDAEKQYSAVLAADAANDKARFGLAVLYDRTSRPELALKEFRVLSSRNPELAEAEFIRAGQEARKSREYQRAEKYFQRAADINPQLADVWAELGTNSYLAGEHARGVEFFRKALAIQPGRAEYHYYLALALDRSRLAEEAVREYRRCLELGGPPEARLGLARAAMDAGDPGVAVEELNRLLAASPDHAEAKTLLAQATAEMETRRRLLEGQSQFANQRLARLEEIVADANRAKRDLEGRLEAAVRDKRPLEERAARLQGELDAEREARRRETAEAQAALAVLRAQKEQADRDLIAERERPKRDLERLQAELAAAQAAARATGQASGEPVELRVRLAGLQAEHAKLQTELSQERDARRQESARAKSDLATEREGRRAEVERLRAELAAADATRRERDQRANEAAELRGRLAAVESAAARAEQSLATERERSEKALASEREQGKRALASEQEARRAETGKLTAELEAARVKKQDQERLAKELGEERERAAAAQSAREKAEKSLAAEREQGRQALAAERGKAEQALSEERERSGKALAAEREARRDETGKLTAELEAARVKKKDQERLAKELGEERERAAAAQAARERAEHALVAEREQGKQLLTATTEKAGRDLAAERERAVQELAAERAKAGEALQAEREERRREAELAAARSAALVEQQRGTAAALASREAELAAAGARVRELDGLVARLQAELARGGERIAAMEAAAATAAAALAERDRALGELRHEVRDLALELGRAALLSQLWEKARGYLELAVGIDPSAAEAWLGLGEALFQLGKYEESKRMYLKAKSIY